MDSQTLNQPINLMEDRDKENHQTSYVFLITNCIICSMLTTNSITLAHSIVQDRISRSYIGYSYLVSSIYSTAVGEYRKAINHKGRYNTATEDNTVEIPFSDNICMTVQSFSSSTRPLQQSCRSIPNQTDTPH